MYIDTVTWLVKNPPAMQGTPVWFLGLEDPLGEGIGYALQYTWASLEVQLIKNLPAMWETWVRSLGWEDPVEKERLPNPVFWPREFHGLYSSMGSQRVRHNWTTFTFTSLSQIMLYTWNQYNVICQVYHNEKKKPKFMLLPEYIIWFQTKIGICLHIFLISSIKCSLLPSFITRNSDLTEIKIYSKALWIYLCLSSGSAKK